MLSRRLMLGAALAAAAAVALPGAGRAQGNSGPIRIATAGPMTGQYAAFGGQMRAGAEQAVTDINGAGGVLGRQLALEIGDDACDPRQAVSVANQLAGRRVTRRVARTDHVNAGLMRVFDRLQDTPAQVVNTLGETLIQTPPAVALLGDETSYSGPARSRVYRWFTDPEARRTAPVEDHPRHGRALVAGIA